MTVIPRQRVVVLVLVATLLAALVGGLLAVGSHRGPTGWQRLEVPGGGSFGDLIETSGGFLAVGTTDTGSGIWTSRDCIHWASVPTGDPFMGGFVNAVTTGGPGLVAVGSVGGSVADQRGAAWTSADGRTWTRVPDDSTFDKMWLSDVIQWDGRLVAVGGSAMGRNVPAIWTSDDGVRWARVAPLEGDDPGYFGRLIMVVAGGPGLVTTGEVDAGAPVWTSVDGLAWHRAPGGDWPSYSRVRDVARGADGRFVASGGSSLPSSPVIWDSDDGTAWTGVATRASLAATSNPASSTGPISVVATDRGFLAVGYDYLERYQGSDMSLVLKQGLVWTSADGRSWARLADDPVFAHAELDRVMACGDSLVVSGRDVRDTQGREWPGALWGLPGGIRSGGQTPSGGKHGGGTA